MGPPYYPMQGVHNTPFDLPSITHRESNEHISELYHFEGLVILTWNFDTEVRSDS